MPVQLENEDDLIEKAKNDPQAFIILYNHYFSSIYKYAYYHTLQKQDAEDIVSQTFLQAMENIKRYKNQGVSFGAWLYRIASNIMYHKRYRMNREHLILQPHAPFGDEGMDMDLDVDVIALLHLMRDLPTSQRQALELRYIQNMSIKEVAQIMKRSEGAVKQMTHRGIKFLKERMTSND